MTTSFPVAAQATYRHAKRAIIVTDAMLKGSAADQQIDVVEKTAGLLRHNGYNVECKSTEVITLEDAAERIRPFGTTRQQSVAYIAGAAAGYDPGVTLQVEALAAKAANEGYHTVFPGSRAGMMGILAKAVKQTGHKITSVFSLAVARGVIEQLHFEAEAIIVTPDERTRQICYSLLGGAGQIALPGGTGTLTEAMIKHYDDRMNYIYRGIDITPDIDASPLIIFDIDSPRLNGEFKRVLADIFENNRVLQNRILTSPDPVGFYQFLLAQLKLQTTMGFIKAPEMKFIERATNPDEVLSALQKWQQPQHRMAVVRATNHHAIAHNRPVATPEYV